MVLQGNSVNGKQWHRSEKELVCKANVEESTWRREECRKEA